MSLCLIARSVDSSDEIDEIGLDTQQRTCCIQTGNDLDGVV